MKPLPSSVARFLAGRRFAVAGVSRDPQQPANAIFRKLRDAGFEVFAINPAAREVEEGTAYPDLSSAPQPLDGVVIVTRPAASLELVREASRLGIPRVWLHRSIGEGSVAPEAVEEARRLGLDCLVGGCPMMFVEPVDVFHRCLRWWCARKGPVPA